MIVFYGMSTINLKGRLNLILRDNINLKKEFVFFKINVEPRIFEFDISLALYLPDVLN